MSESIIKPLSPLERTERELQRIENEIVSEAAEMVNSVLRFAEVNPEDGQGGAMPDAWLDELANIPMGSEEWHRASEELAKRHRVAKAGWMSAKEAPVALAIAKSVLVGAMKARAMAGAAPKSLNVTVVSISDPNQPPPMFEEKEVEHE